MNKTDRQDPDDDRKTPGGTDTYRTPGGLSYLYCNSRKRKGKADRNRDKVYGCDQKQSRMSIFVQMQQKRGVKIVETKD